MQPLCSGIVFKFLKVGCPDYRSFFEQNGVVRVVDVREIFVSEVYFQITSTAAEDAVDGMAEESMSQSSPLMNTRCYEENCQTEDLRVLHEMWFHYGGSL